MQWIKEELDILKRYYGKMPASQLIEKHLPDRTVVAVHKKALKMGLKADRRKMTSIAKKKYWCNENFFNSGDLSSCYWAGFIAADGCVIRQNNSLKIELGLKDSGHLHKFRNAVEFTGLVRVGNTTQIKLYGFPSVLNDLENRFCITERKTFTLQPPKLSDENDVRAFIRGYFDGDGSISRVNANNTYRVSITSGSKDILNWIESSVKAYLPSIKCSIYNDKKHHQLIFGGSRQSLRFLNWLYEDSTKETRLDRKYSLFLKLANRCDEIDQYQASVYRGVCWDQARQLWSSNIEIDGKKKYIGRFNSEKEAAIAYNKKAEELGLQERCYDVR